MPYVIRPTTVIQNYTSQTQNGEITVNLNLTITVNGDGSVSVAPNAAAVPEIRPTPPKPKIDDDKVDFLIPDFEPINPSEFLNFED